MLANRSAWLKKKACILFTADTALLKGVCLKESKRDSAVKRELIIHVGSESGAFSSTVVTLVTVLTVQQPPAQAQFEPRKGM